MLSLKEIYTDISFKKIEESASFSSEIHDNQLSFESKIQKSDSYPARDFGIQQKIRVLFGKAGVNRSDIGGHPHFNYLAGMEKLKEGFTVSLFMDIKGSTKLGIIYPINDVFRIKNTIIKCAIETILAFDGHVHRIMGDAVLAFFRSDGVSARNSSIDAINCGAYLVQLMKEVVIPELKSHGLDEDVGIRIGIDYGPEKEVLWGMYGYSGASEVTATSFHVDVAAKLQQAAPRNRVMLGNSIKELLDLHEDIIENKFFIENGKKNTAEFISPNYLDSSGKKINYKQFVLRQKNYFNLLPKPSDANNKIKLTSTLKSKAGTPSTEEYHRCSRVIPRSKGIEFKASFYLTGNHQKIQVKFRVENHGKQAFEKNGDSYGNHENLVEAITTDGINYIAKNWEDTSYIGLHYMYVSVYSEGNLIIPELCFAVYVGDPT